MREGRWDGESNSQRLGCCLQNAASTPICLNTTQLGYNIHFLLMLFWDNGSFICVLSSSYIKTKDTLTEDLKEGTLMNWEFKIQMALPLSVLTCFINIWRLIYSRLAGQERTVCPITLLNTQLEKTNIQKWLPFYGLIDGTFGSKIVTSIPVTYCSDQGQVCPSSRPREKLIRVLV